MPKNKPMSITTSRYRRNLVIAGIILLALIIALGAFFANQAVKSNQTPSVIPFVPTQIQDKDPAVTEIQEASENINTPEEARNAIASYYNAIANKDVAALKSMGAMGTANAMSKGWLDAIGYKMDIGRLGNPDAQAFPAAQGLYAGCTFYKVSDFYTSDIQDAIESVVYGKRNAEGWIYYDPINAKWIIVDPTIPTAFAAPQAQNIERTSENKQATVRMSCVGVYSNPWWSWAICDIQLTNNSTDTPILVSKASHDSGFSVNVPEVLLQGAPTATPSGGTTVKDSCTMWRGDVGSFTSEKIGAKPLEVDGDIAPITASFGDEDISPIFTVGKADSSELAQEIAAEQIEEYGAVETSSDSEEEEGE